MSSGARSSNGAEEQASPREACGGKGYALSGQETLGKGTLNTSAGDTGPVLQQRLARATAESASALLHAQRLTLKLQLRGEEKQAQEEWGKEARFMFPIYENSQERSCNCVN